MRDVRHCRSRQIDRGDIFRGKETNLSRLNSAGRLNLGSVAYYDPCFALFSASGLSPMLFYQTELTLFFREAKLGLIKRRKRAACAYEFKKVSLFNDFSTSDNDDQVRLPNGRETVSDNEGRAVSH